MNKCCRNCKYLYLNWRSTPQEFCSLISNVEDDDIIFEKGDYYPVLITKNNLKETKQKFIVGISFLQTSEENVKNYNRYKEMVFKQTTQEELKELNRPITAIPLFIIKDSDAFYCSLYKEDSMSYEERITKSGVGMIMGLPIDRKEKENK